MSDRLNLQLPGNPRYQPKEMIPIFGYDHLYRHVARIEIANLEVLAEIGYLPTDAVAAFGVFAREIMLGITTSEVDIREREKTKHDIRAWVQLAQERVPPEIGRWIHHGLTSYDPLDTGRILGFIEAHLEIHKAAEEVALMLAELTERYAGELQIGRTHLQAALPITVGFWFATLLYRLLWCLKKADTTSSNLPGKVSGGVGAYNAQKGLGILARCGKKTFEERVLAKLGLSASPISTQILPPEPLADYLFSLVLMSGALAQLGRDARILQATEIGEVAESFEPGQVGSSTMGQKNNPINFENTEGQFTRTKNEFGKVLDTLVTILQRDLVGSCVARDFPIIPINVMTQLNTLRRKNDKGVRFLDRLSVNVDRCLANFQAVASSILAEPVILALQLGGYRGDAHKLITDRVAPESKKTGRLIIEILEVIDDEYIQGALAAIPEDVRQLLHRPEDYTGLAKEKALEIARLAREQLGV